ncbi:hypothetical protein [Granulicella arctica]|uniref:Septal ring factor EnvC (AmiA/AmiB activator) n=1 Tax=Granulicella arctica TaxID=940613 RepID=A0A7Y9PK60_9BACT|nr:hypothetical protein [Granulicella arctica]NYF81380.1 septal ring factor EnvC (AmiA/AmiB activator) [Granulicella arctica]
MADMFFATKTASEKANEAAVAAMAENVRTDLGQVTTAHAGLYRQLQEQSAQIAEVAEDTRRTRAALDSSKEQVTVLEKQITALGVWVKTGVGLLVLALALLIAVLMRGR